MTAADDRMARERARLADELHGGVVQQVTALSLAVDHALLHQVAGEHAAAEAALRTARRLADATADGCRALIDGLRAEGDP